MAHVIFRIDKPKSATVAMNHFLRVNPTPNADPSRTHLNRVLVGVPDPNAIQAACDAPKARQKNTVRAVGFVLTASPEWFQKATPDEVEKWVATADKWLKKEFGSRLLFSHLQMDESTPHIQGIILPTDENGQLKARTVFGPVALRRMQTSAGEAFKPLGIERGIEGSKATHTRIKEYYGALHGPMPKVSLPAIPPVPPLHQRGEAALQAWAEGIRDATWNAAQAPLTVASRAADAGREAIRQRDQLTWSQAQWKKSAEAANKGEREMSAKLDDLRQISVEETLAELGFEQDSREREKWKNGSAIVTVKDDFAWFDHQNVKGGGGALDLVMHVLGKPLGAAAGWLRKHFGAERATQTVAAPAIRQARKQVTEAKPAATAPEPSEKHWPRVQKYLVGRGLPAALIDTLRGRGDLFADARGHAVFSARDEKNEIVGASLRGTGPGSSFKQRFGRKDAGAVSITDGGPIQYVAVVESAIDAASYKAIADARGGGKGLLVVSTDGAGKPPEWLVERHKTATWVLAQDADDRGDAMATTLGAGFSQAGIKHSRFRPDQLLKGAKDWNDVLMNKSGGGGTPPKVDLSQGIPGL